MPSLQPSGNISDPPFIPVCFSSALHSWGKVQMKVENANVKQHPRVFSEETYSHFTHVRFTHLHCSLTPGGSRTFFWWNLSIAAVLSWHLSGLSEAWTVSDHCFIHTLLLLLFMLWITWVLKSTSDVWPLFRSEIVALWTPCCHPVKHSP